MNTFRLSPLARQDLVDIWKYSSVRWGERQAETYIRRLNETFERLATGLIVGRRIDDVRLGYLKYRIKSHTLYFKLDEHGLFIVRVLHNRRDVVRHFPIED